MAVERAYSERRRGRTLQARIRSRPGLSFANRLISVLVSGLWRFRKFPGRQAIVDRLLPFVEVIPSYRGPVLRVRHGDFTGRLAIFGGYGDEIFVRNDTATNA